MKFTHLEDDGIRESMCSEVTLALLNQSFYQPMTLDPEGMELWPRALLEVCADGNPRTLRKKLSGHFLKHDYAKGLTDNEFNRYYMIAVCHQAIEHEEIEVEVYMAGTMPSRDEQIAKQALDMMHERVDALDLLEYLRRNDYNRNTEYDPLGRNKSPLSVRRVSSVCNCMRKEELRRYFFPAAKPDSLTCETDCKMADRLAD